MKEMKIEVKLDEERTKAKYRMSENMNVGELGMCALLGINGIYTSLAKEDAEEYRNLILQVVNNDIFWEIQPDERNGMAAENWNS